MSFVVAPAGKCAAPAAVADAADADAAVESEADAADVDAAVESEADAAGVAVPATTATTRPSALRAAMRVRVNT
jgi:hypothetical protein